MGRSLSPRLSPAHSTSSDSSSRANNDAVSSVAAVAAVSPIGGAGTSATSARNFKATQAASIAAVVESTSAHRTIIPGLAELMGGSSGMGMLNIPYFKSSSTATTNAAGGSTTASPDRSHHTMNPNASSEGGGTTDGDDKTDAMETEATTTTTTVVGHPSLPSIESVATVASRLINECPPFISMSVRDTAPQLKLEDPPNVLVLDKESSDQEGGTSSIDFRRRLVVKGGMKGYRMSRTTHGVSSGCYYYEAVILGSETNDNDNESDRGVKRPHDETTKEDTPKETNESSNENDSEPRQKKQKTNSTVNSTTTTTTRNGHVRVGWSTRLADLQAPVGYNEHSYGIRDIQGSRIHKSRREDTWGGIEFGPGDVIGCAIIFCLGDNKKAAAASNSSPLANPNGNSNNGETTTQKKVESAKEGRSHDAAATSSGDGKDAAKKTSTTLANHIRFFKNGVPMGKDGIAFNNITPGTYHPSISCYMDGASQLNFGPHFVYPPTKGGIKLPVAESSLNNNIRPISELCTSPPLPEDAIDKVLTGDGSKEGKKIFFSKRTDDGIVSAFKELVKTESTIRWDAHVKHLELHRREVMALRKERGLDVADLEESSMQLS